MASSDDPLMSKRVEVLTAQLAESRRLVQKLQADNAALRAELAECRATMKLEAGHASTAGAALVRRRWTKERLRFPPDLLLAIWNDHQAGASVDQLSIKYGSNKMIVAKFLSGDYTTEAAKAVYQQLGVFSYAPAVASRKKSKRINSL